MRNNDNDVPTKLGNSVPILNRSDEIWYVLQAITQIDRVLGSGLKGQGPTIITRVTEVDPDRRIQDRHHARCIIAAPLKANI